MPWVVALGAVALAACGSSSSSAPTGPTCGDDQRVGQFTLELKPALGGAPPYAQVNGLVRDAVDPKEVWTQVAHQGACQVLIGPVASCAPACGSGTVCRAGACVPAPVGRSLGMATMSGLLAPLAMTPNASTAAYYGPISGDVAFPPYALGGKVGLATEGGDYAPLSLEATGISPLDVPDGQSLALTTTVPNGPLVVHWTAAPAASAGRVELSFDVAHHAGIAAVLECDVPDTGTATVPGALIDDLVARGTGGFPELLVTRASVDMASIQPGCVTFSVASSVAKQLTVETVTSCSQDEDCPAPQRCLASLKCG